MQNIFDNVYSSKHDTTHPSQNLNLFKSFALVTLYPFDVDLVFYSDVEYLYHFPTILIDYVKGTYH